MRTTDLIPLILLELNESDKYGFELVKAIETKSNSKIIIKQPTLYTILKKLEKSKFISSYWQDSDIGGKRHYYRLSDNGRAQISTLPNYSTLLETAIQNDIIDSSNEITSTNNVVETTQIQSSDISNQVQSSISDIISGQTEQFFQEEKGKTIENLKEESHEEKEQYVSIMDLLADNNDSDQQRPEQLTLQEAVLPTEEVFANNSIDILTETEQNLKNTDILKTEAIQSNEQFATSENVKTFTEKKSTELSDEYKDKFRTTNQQSLATPLNPKPVEADIDSIRFVEYENVKTNPSYVQSKSLTKSMLLKIFSSSTYLLLSLVLCAIITSFTHTSALYYVFLILGIFTLIFYPTIFAFNLDIFKEKCQNNKYKSKKKLRTIFAICFMIGVILICVVTNIAIKKGEFIRMFTDFANFYAPIIISSVVCFDILFTYLFITKKHKL